MPKYRASELHKWLRKIDEIENETPKILV
jgi:hypothetical protein